MRRNIFILLLVGAFVSSIVGFASSQGEPTQPAEELLAQLEAGKASRFAEWTNKSIEELYKEGYDYMNRGVNDSALISFTILSSKSQDRLTKKEKRLCVQAYNNLGILYSYVYFNYPKAFSYMDRELSLAKESGFDDMLPALYATYAGIMLNNDNFRNPDIPNPKTFKVFKDAFYTSVKLKDWRNLLFNFDNITNAALSYSRMDLVMSEIATFKKLNIPTNTPYLEFSRKQCEGMLAVSKKNYDAALSSFRNSMKGLDSTDITASKFMTMAYNNMAYTYALMGKYRDAINMTEKMIDLQSKDNLSDALIFSYKEMSEYYRKMGDQTLADRYFMKYLQHKDSFMYSSKLLDAEENKFLGDLQEAQDELQMVSMKKKTQTVINWILAVALLVTFLLLYLVWRGYQNLKIKNRELYQKNVDMLKVDDERRKISEALKRQNINVNPQPAVMEEEPSQAANSSKYQRSRLSESAQQEIASRIIDAMDNIDEVCSEQFSLSRLAQLAQSTRNDVSQVLNDVIHKPFNVLLGEYRIKEACRRMNDSRYSQYTIESIGNSVGYKSRTSFVYAFKRNTGLTPSEYLKLAREDASGK
ncbi:MAG: helix-turn-helix domain-containing protein [Prevotella sp.]|jgi:AraC-like DNA-binding protein